MRAMPVRAATEDDLDEICAMVHELAEFEQAPDEVALDPEDLRRHVFGPDPVAHVFIAYVEDDPARAAGMAVWYRTYSTWVGRPGVWLEDLFVRPEYRRLGLARQLLDALADRTEGRVEWSVLDWNEGAIAFYDGLGAAPVPGWSRYRWTPAAAR